MYKKVIKYTDFNDTERIEEFYFNLNKAELVEMQANTPGGLLQFLVNMDKDRDMKKMVDFIKNLIRTSYGVKSEDGKTFVKNDAIWESFHQSNAYEELFMSLATDEKAGSEFIAKVMPRDLAEQAAKMSQEDLQKALAEATTPQ